MPRRSKNDPTYRPYDPNFHPADLVDKMSKGMLNVEVASAWNICVDTLTVWRKEHPELQEAYSLGLTHYEAWFIQNRFTPMIEGKLEGKHSFNSAIAIANNKLGWSRGASVDKTQNTQININNMQINNNMSIQELTDSLTKDLEYLQNVGIIAQPKQHLIEAQLYDTESDEQDEE